jgi:hypothetical protein
VTIAERGDQLSATDEPIDLWSHEDVAANGDAILGRLSNGTMPCGGAQTSKSPSFESGSRGERLRRRDAGTRKDGK